VLKNSSSSLSLVFFENKVINSSLLANLLSKMPTVSLVRDDLFEALGKTYTQEEFDELCFEFGIELDEVTSEAEMAAKEKGANAKTSDLSDEVIYKIDIPANRYDLLCMEGLTRALKIFLGKTEAPSYQIVEPAGGKRQQMVVEENVSELRPFVVSAVLRGVKFDEKRYKSFIDLQDKLHQNICRQRKYVAIGTHDLDTLQGPFRYEHLPPSEINFVPLVPNDRKFEAKALMDHYKTDPDCKHLKDYVGLIYDSPVYPVIYDSNNVVLSLPPLINGDHSKITLDTKNVFIECTATDLTKANIVLDTVVTMFSEHCEKPFTVEPVDVTYKRDGKTQTTPLLSTREESAKVSEVNSTIGISIEPERMCELCTKMQLGPARYDKAADSIVVTVPPTRSDILHAVDVIEDVAIAYGYNNLEIEVPPTLCVGGPQPINHFTDLLREEISRAGYIEMLTHGLCSTEENFTMLRQPVGPAVKLSNPAIIEYEVVRTTLLPGALKTVQHNRSMAVKDGVKLFEISDVVLPDSTHPIGAKNQRRLVAVYVGLTAGFEVIHGLVDRVMALCQVPPTDAYAGNSMREEAKTVSPREGLAYCIAPAENATFFSGRCADVIVTKEGNDTKVGTFGIIHPEVIEKYGISNPCSAVEIDIESLM